MRRKRRVARWANRATPAPGHQVVARRWKLWRDQHAGVEARCRTALAAAWPDMDPWHVEMFAGSLAMQEHPWPRRAFRP